MFNMSIHLNNSEYMAENKEKQNTGLWINIRRPLSWCISFVYIFTLLFQTIKQILLLDKVIQNAIFI